MIIDHISNAAQYAGISKGIAAGLAWLAANDFSEMASGRYELDGEKLYAMIQTYDSRDPAAGKWEAHRRYIDIQYIVSGRENIGYARIDTLVGGDYDETKDFLLLQGKGDHLTCTAGTFMILYPQDAHMPGMAIDQPEPVRKVVVKVLAD